MAVKYEDAMQTLTTMFGSVDREVIDAVLRANDWHMERTIDALLSMSDSEETTAPLASRLPSLSSSSAPSSDPIVESATEHPQQMEQDEMLARALQNEMFLTEVRSNPELAAHDSTFDNDLSLKEVKDKFNQLGGAAKSKLRELSTMFFKRDDKYQAVDTNSLIVPSTSHAHSTNLVDGSAVDDDDEEIVAFDARIAHRRAQAIMMEEDDEDDDELVDHRPHRVAPVGTVGPDQ